MGLVRPRVRFRLPALAVASLLVGLGSSDCGGGIEACSPTAVEAEPPTGEVLTARVHSGSQPLRGREVTFTVRSDDTVLLRTDATVARDATATVDLAEHAIDPSRVERFTVRFPGDRAFCDSMDEAVRAPGGG